MSIEKTLHSRSESKCELCNHTESLSVYNIPPYSNDNIDECVLICHNCSQQIDNPDSIDVHHWHCLNESMWSQIPAVQVMAWRLLSQLKGENWAADLLDMLYLDDETLVWAKTTESTEETVQHIDSHGVILSAGDTVTLIKDLVVKGANFTAKRGTAVRNISLVHDNAEQIGGRVNGQKIIILTQFVKK